MPTDTTYAVTEALDEVTPGLAEGYRWDLTGLDCTFEPAQPDATSDRSSVSESVAAASATITFGDFESRTVSCPFTNSLCSVHPFRDVPLWVDPAVDWAYCGTYMDGYPGNLFNPNDDISRAQIHSQTINHPDGQFPMSIARENL